MKPFSDFCSTVRDSIRTVLPSFNPPSPPPEHGTIYRSLETAKTELKALLHAVLDESESDISPLQTNMPGETRDILIQLLKLALSLGLSYYVGIRIMERMDPTRKQKQAAKMRAQELMQRIGISGIKLTEHELCFAADLIDPESITISWRDIGGLDDVIRTIREKVIFPFKRRDLLQGSSLIRPPKGVLLYGPPGCGKTTIAKAMAKDSGARFISFQVSSMLDKWYGESEKRADALFSLARKIQPVIIFIDEIDSFLRVRNTLDHASTSTIKGQFMSLWDGLITDDDCQILIVGATNRPQDVDDAILRRMSSKFSIGKPATQERMNILRIILRTENMDGSVDLNRVASQTEGFSGSELHEACRLGATQRIHEIMREANKSHLDDIYDVPISELRPMSMADLIHGVNAVKCAKNGILNPSLASFPMD